MTELCADFGISRKTGYKILNRYETEGPEGLRDQSRAPHRHPNQTPADIETLILRHRKAHPSWGSKKILVKLNGRHERFHETLKAEAATPPRGSIRAQQAAFQRFRTHYNEERPHEALGMRTPSEFYTSSKREMLTTVPEFEYDDSLEVRRVRRDGSIKWSGTTIFVGSAMVGESVGVEALEDGHHQLHLGPMPLGILNETRIVMPAAGGTE